MHTAEYIRQTPIAPERWPIAIAGMPEFDKSMDRIDAWYHNEIIDRPPVRFVAHNAFLELSQGELVDMSPDERQARWFDAEYQVKLYLKSIAGRNHLGETFPLFFPNLGPDLYAALYGARLEFGEVTSWSVPIVKDWSDAAKLQFDPNGVYFRKIEEITAVALEMCRDKALVGYTDLHPGLDCVAAWRDPQQLCFDMIDSPEEVAKLSEIAIADFERIYDHFDGMLREAGQPSVGWMGIPSFGRFHIPSCDFSTMISPGFFNEFGLPILQREVKTMTHNVFHMDGKGVARHLDAILSVPEVHALQWVQGVGDDQPIMQWVPFIKDIQARGVPVIVDLTQKELHGFMEAMSPEGLFLWIATTSEEEERTLLKSISRWK
ncbi:MAG: hypothetical protein J5I90_07190 [Caldilineales bacterium]|nr:hypothetical protein [Caldilineales bacterium]